MKKQDLYNYVKTEVINELTIVSKSTSSDEVDNIAKTEKTDAGTVKKAIDAAKSTGKDVNIAEMARTPNKIKVGDPAKIALAKKLYDGMWKGVMLDKVVEAGEEGISQLELAHAIGKSSQPTINPSVNEFIRMGAFAFTKIAKVDPEPEEYNDEENDGSDEGPISSRSKSKEDDDVEVKDDWEKPEEDDSYKESEPKAADIKAIEKLVGKGNAKTLSPEDEEKYQKLRKGIDAKISKLKPISKAKRASSDDFKILKQLIGREDVKKLFKAKGVDLKSIVASIM